MLFKLEDLKIKDVVEIKVNDHIFLGEICAINNSILFPIKCLIPLNIPFGCNLSDLSKEVRQAIISNCWVLEDSVKLLQHKFSNFSINEIISKTDLKW